MSANADIFDSWRCRSCGDTFAKPSFSEGPKVWDEGLQKIVRFREACSLCPTCFSSNITPEPVDRSLAR